MPFEKDGWTMYNKGEHPVGVFIDGSLVRITGIQLNELGNYNIKWKSYYLKSLFDNELHNVPKFLITLKTPLKDKPIPKEGVWFINTTISGRNFLRANTSEEWQKMIYHVKREIDITNTGLLFSMEKLKSKDKGDFAKALDEFRESCKKFNSFLYGKEYQKYLLQNDHDLIFKTYVQLAHEKEPVTHESWSRIVNRLSYKNKFVGGNDGTVSKEI